MAYHHGVETVEIDRGPRPVREVRTAAILLLGTAPEGPVQEITLVRSKRDAVQFGKQIEGHTIPQALDSILKQGNALVAVINVASDDHLERNASVPVVNEVLAISGSDVTPIVNEAVTFVAGTATLDNRLNTFVGLVVTSTDGLTTYVKDTDFSITLAGVITNITIGATASILVDYVPFIGGEGKTATALTSVNTSVLTASDGLTTYVRNTDYTIDVAGNVTSITLPDGSYLIDYTTYENTVVESMKFQSVHAPNEDGGYLVHVSNADDTVTYVIEDDYTLDEYGRFKVTPGGDITEGDTLLLKYDYFLSSLVTGSDFIGTFNTGTGARTGFFLSDLCYNEFGFMPKIIIVPGYSTNATVFPEMLARAEQFRAMALFDSTSAQSVSEIITARAGTGNFGTANGRAILCYPGVNVVHPDLGTEEIRPMSQYIAGLISKVDETEGHWVSPSNHEVIGIVSLESDVTWNFQAISTEANALNEVGICTMGKPFGSGWRFWGNRSAQYPTDTAVDNFIPVRRVADILHESVEMAMLPFIDKPITNAVIADIKETVNGYIRSLVQRGALISGECSFDPDKNPPLQVAAGHLVFDLDFMPPTPAERISFESFINIERLTALV